MEKFLKYTIKPIINNKDSKETSFVLQPLEKGFGTTIGNALRRTLLSNIPGASIFAIKIPGITHEFQAIKGIKEDVTQIVLNLKNLVLKISESAFSDDELASTKLEQWPTLHISKKKTGVVTAADIEVPVGMEVVNKNLYICTITDDKTSLDMEIYATRGRGFRTFTENREIVNSLSVIATDSNFSPIIQVGYHVEDYKISKTVTGDSLTMNVVTNGSIEATNAVALAAKILSEHFIPLIDLDAKVKEVEIINQQIEEQKANTLSIAIEELDLSVRSYNCLKNYGIHTIQELTNMTKSQVAKINNLGNKSLREIQKKLTDYGLTFKTE